MNIERALATIRQCSEIVPIIGADKIEIAKIDGWQCVVEKNTFKPGDLGVYIEIDSFLPIEERWEFLRKSSLKKLGDVEGFRIKTVKLMKQLSQGLFKPLKQFPEIQSTNIGEDVTKLLNIKLYEQPVSAALQGKARGNFPSFLIKTDQERIQNNKKFFEIYKDMPWEVSIKLDGTSSTFFYNNGKFGVCSRNLELKEEDTNTYCEMARRYHLRDVLTEFCQKNNRNISLQGEIIGTGIQKNNEKISGQEFYLFDIFDIDKQEYVKSCERFKILNEINNILINIDDNLIIKHVPVINYNQCVFKDFTTMEELLKYADGSSLNPLSKREGLVFKSLTENVSFKAISNEYLLGE